MTSSAQQDGAKSESEEEEDYMSDAFLQKLEKGDIRPGLKHVRQDFGWNVGEMWLKINEIKEYRPT